MIRKFLDRLKTRSYQTRLQDAPNALDRTSLTPPDSDIYESLDKLKAMSRQEVQRSGTAKGFTLAMERNVLGPRGMTLRSLVKTQSLRDEIEGRWNEYAQNPIDVTEELSLWDCGRIVLRDLLVDGEAFVRMHPTGDYGTQLELVDSALLSPRTNGQTRDGAIVQMGIERNPFGKAIAYHFHLRPQQRHLFPATYHPEGGKTIRVPAEEILFVYEKTSAGAQRGVPWMHSVLTTMGSLRKYQETEQLAARAGSKNLGFIETDLGGETAWRPTDENATTPPISGKQGAINELLPGQKFNAWQPSHPNSNYPNFNQQQMLVISQGLGISAMTLTQDLSSVNFSGGRLGRLSEQDTFLIVRRLMSQRFYSPLFKQWVRQSVLRGKLPLRADLDKMMKHEFVGRSWSHVQPREEATAREIDAALGYRSISEMITESGRDPEEVARMVQEDRERFGTPQRVERVEVLEENQDAD